MAKDTPRGIGQIILRLLFLLYIGLMLWLLFGQRIDSGGTEIAENWNFVPFRTVKLYLRLLANGDESLVRHAFINLVGNVVMFIPLGLFLPGIWGQLHSFARCFVCAVLLIVVIEAVQYVTKLGSCDVDDLLLNLPGVIIGYGLYRRFL